ncbi:MAG: hypothetical protein SNJ67_08940 [Chloracidobacterium sp.]|uniref:Uncharacterized protein n=1 Tax=Chloracidobacterium validum TaxID=2821543 RepID=A0ABX8B5V1_9BACT|nr:hypothetical protein [Chloracidobacterium validum]QUW02347.1 hypothetical protein J8C06_08255 [Chloracidobacterium validum]
MPTLIAVEAPVEVCTCGATMEASAQSGPRRFDYVCPACDNHKANYAAITIRNSKTNRVHRGWLVGKTKPVYIGHVLYHQLTIEIPQSDGAEMCHDLSMRMAYGRKPHVTLEIADGRSRGDLIFLFNRGWMEDEQHTTIVLEEVGRSLFE